MCGGLKPEHEEHIERVRQATTRRGVSRIAGWIYRRHAGERGRDWGQHDIERAVRERKRELNRERRDIGESVRRWISDL